MTTKDTFTNAMFIGSFPSHKGLPDDLGDEIAFCGRSNSGKSSAISALSNSKKLAKTSKTPGRTQSITKISALLIFLAMVTQTYLNPQGPNGV